jgi:hypothetical protein
MKLSAKELQEQKKYSYFMQKKMSDDLLECTKRMFEEMEQKNEKPFERLMIFIGWGNIDGTLDENGDFKIFVSYYKRKFRDAGFQEDGIRMWVVEKDNLYPRDVVEIR